MIAIAICLILQDSERIETNQGCQKCHTEQTEVWSKSVHKNANASCIECHGADEVLSTELPNHRKRPGFKPARSARSVPDLCGSCHASERDQFMKCEHGEETRKGGFQACRDCHGKSHETMSASRSRILRDNCMKCHKNAPQKYRDAAEYVSLMEGFAGDDARLVRKLDEPRRPGISRLEAAEAHATAVKTIARARVAQHGLNFSKKETSETSARLSEAYNNLSQSEKKFAGRFLWLGLFLALVAGNAALVKLKALRFTKGK